jgi:hypothetical protein
MFAAISSATRDALAGKPIPSGKDAYTNAQFQKDLRAYSLHLLDFYDKHTQDPAEARAAAKAFCLAYLHRAFGEAGAPTWKELSEQADKLLAVGEADPLVLANIGQAKLEAGKGSEAKAILTKAHKGFSSSSYPACWKYRGCNRLRMAFMATNTPPEEWHAYRYDFVRLIVDMMAEAVDEPANRRFLWAGIENTVQISDDNSPGPFALQTAIYEAVQKAEKIDPWMKNMVNGSHHFTVGWRLRGGGTIDTVSEDGLRGFSEHLEKASEYFTKAWEIDPKIPDAPTRMIQVSMAIGSKDLSPRDWFDRAVEAMMDYTPAYQAQGFVLAVLAYGSSDNGFIL